MADLMNFTYLEGNVVRDVELRTSQKGTKVATMTLAVPSRFNEQTSFLDIVLFNDLAEVAAKEGAKGTLAKVVGYQQRRSYEDKNGGKRYVVETVADMVRFIARSDKQGGDIVEDFDDKPIDLSEIPF